MVSVSSKTAKIQYKNNFASRGVDIKKLKLIIICKLKNGHKKGLSAYKQIRALFIACNNSRTGMLQKFLFYTYTLNAKNHFTHQVAWNKMLINVVVICWLYPRDETYNKTSRGSLLYITVIVIIEQQQKVGCRILNLLNSNTLC